MEQNNKVGNFGDLLKILLDEKEYIDMLTNEVVSGEVKLNRFDVRVLKR